MSGRAESWMGLLSVRGGNFVTTRQPPAARPSRALRSLPRAAQGAVDQDASRAERVEN